VPQTITNFSEYRGAERAPVASTEPAAAPQPRKFVMLFDDMSLHPMVTSALRKQTDELVGKVMQPGDELMVITPADRKTKILLPFTSDKRAIHDAIETVMKRDSFHADNELIREQLSFERDVANATLSARRAGAQAYARGMSRRVKETLGHLQALVAGLAEVPGRKSVIFVTQSLPIEPGFEAFDQDMPLPGTWATLRTYLQDIARTASTNGVTIYCLQPDIPLGGLAGIDVEQGGRGHRRIAEPERRSPSVSVQGTQQAFEILSRTTGGMWRRGGAGIEPLFEQIADDTTDYYSLGYRAASDQLDQTRSIAVRVRNHPQYEVRSRRAVVRKSPTNEMRDLTIARLLDDRPIDELNVRVTTGKPQRERGALLLPVEVKVPLAKLTFLRDGDVYRATFRVHYAAESSTMLDFAPGEGREQVVTVPSADMPNIGDKIFTYTSSLRVLPGETKVAVGVLDPVSKLATIKTLHVLLPARGEKVPRSGG